MWWCENCKEGDGYGNHRSGCYLEPPRRIPNRGERKALANLYVKLVAADEVRKQNPWNPRLPEVQDWHQRIRGV